MVSLQCVFGCVLWNENFHKILIHRFHKKMVSLQSVTFLGNGDPLTSLSNGFFPVCVSMCLFKLEPSEYADPQTTQKYGFSPVWIRMCTFKLDFSENADPQTSQENGFSPVWVRMWFFKFLLLANAESQTSQEMVFDQCVLAYLFFVQNTDLQFSKENYFSLVWVCRFSICNA